MEARDGFWLSLGAVLGFFLAGSVYWGLDFQPTPSPQRPNAVIGQDYTGSSQPGPTQRDFAPRKEKADAVPAHYAWWLGPARQESVSEPERADRSLTRYTWGLTLFAGILAFAIVGLSVAAIGIYSAGEKQIAAVKQAVDAAAENAKAFMSAERAALFIQINSETVADLVTRHGGPDRSVEMFPGELETPALVYSFKNTGRTAAILKEVSNQLVFQADFPEAAGYRIRETMPGDLVVEAGKTSAVFGCLAEDAFADGKAADFQNGRSAFWFYGYVKFDDAFGREHECRWGFCYRRGYDRFRLVYYREFPDRTETQADLPVPAPSAMKTVPL